MGWFARLLGFDDGGLMGSLDRRVKAKKEESASAKELDKTLEATGSVANEVLSNDKVGNILSAFAKVFGKSK